MKGLPDSHSMESDQPSIPTITVTLPNHDRSPRKSVNLLPESADSAHSSHDRRVKVEPFMSHHSFQITPHTLDHVLNFPGNMRKGRTQTNHDMAIPEDEVHTIPGKLGGGGFGDEEDEDEEDDNPVLMDNMSPATAARTRNKYPNYINKALYHVSDDEKLEALVDEAVLKLLGIKSLWEDKQFVTKLYSDKEFAPAVRAVYEKMAGDVRSYFVCCW